MRLKKPVQTIVPLVTLSIFGWGCGGFEDAGEDPTLLPAELGQEGPDSLGQVESELNNDCSYMYYGYNRCVYVGSYCSASRGYATYDKALKRCNGIYVGEVWVLRRCGC